jgi:hypothetical protein
MDTFLVLVRVRVLALARVLVDAEAVIFCTIILLGGATNGPQIQGAQGRNI